MYTKFASKFVCEHCLRDVLAGGRGGFRDVRHLLRPGAAPRKAVRKNPALGAKVPGGVGRSQLPQHVFGTGGGFDEADD